MADGNVADLAPCPKCDCVYVYEDGALLVCPECAYEWNPEMPAHDERVYKDVNGNVLVEGDMVTIIKDLKVKGTSKVAKVGTRFGLTASSTKIMTLTARLMALAP